MKNIVVFHENEQRILTRIREGLNKIERSEELESMENNEHALHDLAESISLYPSILGVQHLGGISRSVETLVENLCLKDVLDLKLHIPTKAILGQGFTVAKINFFFMLYYLCRETNEFCGFEDLLLEIISNNVFIIMAEEVFLSLISDKDVSLHVRTNAGYLLANIWERRIDYGVKEFSPILNNIWRARHNMKPSFGTMMGISEIFTMSEKSDPVWIEFLEKDDLNQDEIDSLYEFLMGLTFEEMKVLEEEMDKSGKTVLGIKEIDELFGDRKHYPDYVTEDPRELYRSFRHRKKNALFRSRAGEVGPKKTIEEYIMSYLLARPQKM